MAAPTQLSQYYPDVNNDGLFAKDLSDRYGISAYLARKAVAEAGGLGTLPDCGREVSVPSGEGVVALVSTSLDVGARLFQHGLYYRSRELAMPVRRIANHLATDEATDRGPAVMRIHEIAARLVVPNGGTKPQVADPSAQQVIDAAWNVLGAMFFAYNWPVEADVFVLGKVIPVHIPNGHAGGIQGVTHYRLNDLLAAKQRAGTQTL
ncbi:hypothetical protein [Gordonia sihwensis]|uniref:hypothetical protein n=1 Tax=Gordonia sihwensis TaxID=173559 RepID=UPI003D99470F